MNADNKIERGSRHLAELAARREALIARKTEIEATRRGNIVAATAGDPKAARVVEECRREEDAITIQIADLVEAEAIGEEKVAAAIANDADAAHAAKLAEWAELIEQRKAAAFEVDNASQALAKAYGALDGAGQELKALYAEIRPRAVNGSFPALALSPRNTIQRWAAYARALKLDRLLRGAPMTGPDDSTSFAADDFETLTGIPVARSAADAAWTR